MTFRVVITPQAQRDIDQNAEWWAVHHSVEQALRWSDTIYDQIESLTSYPDSHGLSSENDEFPYEIRDKLLGTGTRPTHRAVFTVQNDTVYVLTIRHGAQNELHVSDVQVPPSE